MLGVVIKVCFVPVTDLSLSNFTRSARERLESVSP
jgi:hypothetical protein